MTKLGFNTRCTISGFSLQKFAGNWVFQTNRCSIRGKNPQMLADVLIKGKDDAEYEDFCIKGNQEPYCG